MRHRGTNGAHLRSEIDTVSVDSVVERLDAKRIPGQEQSSSPHVPDGQTKHAVEAIENFIAPLLVSMDDHLRIRFGAENVAVAFQFMPEIEKVVDFTVKNNPNGFFTVRHGLMTAPQVDNREPAKTQSECPNDIVPLVIRSPVAEGLGHPFDVSTLDRLQVAEVILSANAAHLMALVSSSFEQGWTAGRMPLQVCLL